METLRTIEYEANPHQIAILKSDKKLNFMGAGVGSGKTETGTLWMLQRSQESPDGVRHLLGANTYSQLFDSTLQNVLKNLRRFGVEHRPREIGSPRPMTLSIWSGDRWVEWLCRSMDAFESLSGMEIGSFWLDEVWQTKRAAYDVILARLRDMRMPFLQGLLTSTLDDPTSWMYDEFVDGFDDDYMKVVYATTHENEHNLPEDYIDHLRKSYSDRLFQRMVLAKWVTLSSGQIYYNFDRKVHVNAERAEFDPALPILWSHDFNIGDGKPMSSCLCQVQRSQNEDGKWRQELHVFDEIILDTANTRDAATEMQSRPWMSKQENVIVYGDASGKARDTRSKQTDYSILKEEGFGRQKVPEKNPPIRDRHNAVNALLKNADGDARIFLHPRCKTLIKGLETVKLKGGANYLEAETREQHVTTALGYLVHQEFPIIKRTYKVSPLPIGV